MRILLTIILIIGAGLGFAQDTPAEIGKPKVRFATYDVFINSGGVELAAWQFELIYQPKRVAIVGIEGGAKEPFPPGKPPFYDRQGWQGGRIVIAAFTTAKEGLPTTRCRIARLHLRLEGDAPPELELKLVAAARPGGERIPALLELELMQEDVQ